MTLLAGPNFFLTDRRVEIVIDGHKNYEREVETGILQGSPILAILFLIYISGIFDVVTAISPEVSFVSFMDDLGFLTSDNLIEEVATSLETTKETVLKWGLSNVVTYDIAKKEVILFSKACIYKGKEEIAALRLVFGGQKVKFNIKATKWLGIWLDSKLFFDAHIKERIQRAKTAKVRIKGLTKTYKLPSRLIQKIYIAKVQAIAFFGAEI